MKIDQRLITDWGRGSLRELANGMCKERRLHITFMTREGWMSIKSQTYQLGSDMIKWLVITVRTMGNKGLDGTVM